MRAAQSEIAAELASWAIRTARLDQTDTLEEARALFSRMCAELSLVDTRGTPLLPKCTKGALCDFVRTVTCVWTSTPYIWTAMATAPRIPELRLRFELDPARLLGCIVWAYVLEYGVQHLEAHPHGALRIAEIWRTRAETASADWPTIFARVKSVSVFRDPRVRQDPRTAWALTLNANIIEAVLSDLVSLHIANAWSGTVLLGSFTNRSTPGTRRHHQDVGEFRLSDEWIRLYNLWNLSFVCKASRPEALCKLLIPSVVRATGARWLSYRVWALRMTTMSPFYLRVGACWDLEPESAHFSQQASAILPRVACAHFWYSLAEGAAVLALTRTTRAMFTALELLEWHMGRQW